MSMLIAVYIWRLKGQKSCVPPNKKSPINMCEAKAIEYGIAVFLNRIRSKIVKAEIVISECVGPLWVIKRSNKSVSNTIDAVSRRGMFGWIPNFVADVLANKYPMEKWPIASNKMCLE